MTEYQQLSEQAQQMLRENPDLAAEFVNYGAITQRSHSVSSKETIDRFEQLHEEMNDFKGVVTGSLQRIETCVDSVSKKQEEHYRKYKFFYSFLDKSVEAKDSAEWIGSGTYVFLKAVLAMAAVLGGAWLLFKGLWLGLLGVSLNALHNK